MDIETTVGDNGARHLADIIRNNRVPSIVSWYFQIFSRLLKQTITTLTLNGNEIGPVGAQHLADGLRNNQVSLSHISIFLVSIICHPYRHLLH